MLCVVTGSIAAGKSSFCHGTAIRLAQQGTPPGGIIGLRVMLPEHQHGYDALLLPDGRREPLARPDTVWPPAMPHRQAEDHGQTADGGQWPDTDSLLWPRFRKFIFHPAAMHMGLQSITAALAEERPVILDEVGFWELEGGGWAQTLEHFRSMQGNALLSIRKEAISTVLLRWRLKPDRFINLDETPWFPDPVLDAQFLRETQGRTPEPVPHNSKSDPMREVVLALTHH